MKQALNKNILLLFSAYYLKTIANGITYFGSIALVMKLSDNPLHIGIVTMLDTVPYILFSAFAGVLADKYDRKTIISVSYLLAAGTLCALYFAESLWSVYLWSFFSAMAFSIAFPAKRALQPALVDEADYLAVNSFDTMLKSIFQIVRPAFSALVVAFFGPQVAFLLAGAFCVTAALLMVPIQTPEPIAETTEAGEDLQKSSGNGFQQLIDGIRFIRQEGALTYLILVQLLVTLVISMQGTLTFLHVKQYFAPHGDTETIVGLLFSVTGIGGLLGAFYMNKLLRFISMIPLFLLTLALDGVLVVIFALSKNLIVVFGIWIFLGVVGAVNNIVSETVIQKTVEPDMRGRVYGILSTCNEPISLLSTGVGTGLATLIGVKAVFLLAGAAEAVVAIVGRYLPAYDQLQHRMSISEEKERAEAGDR